MTAIPLPIIPSQPVTYGLGGNHIDLLSITGVSNEVIDKGALGQFYCDSTAFTQLVCQPVGVPRDDKAVNTVAASERFEPILLGSAFACQPNPSQPDRISTLAHYSLSLHEWQRIATTIHSNPSALVGVRNWADEATEVVAPISGLAGLTNTISGLLDAAGCACWGAGEQYLHVPKQFMPFFAQDHLVRWQGEKAYIGFLNVVFDCYPNTPPTVNVGGAAAADGSEVWMYLTGDQWIGLGDVYETRAGYTRQNEDVSLVERHALGVFDPCCVFAAKASVC